MKHKLTVRLSMDVRLEASTLKGLADARRNLLADLPWKDSTTFNANGAHTMRVIDGTGSLRAKKAKAKAKP